MSSYGELLEAFQAAGAVYCEMCRAWKLPHGECGPPPPPPILWAKAPLTTAPKGKTGRG
jgi:hypothetical protein